MSRAFTDASKVWIVFDTCTIPDYYLDVHRILAAPPGWIVRYDYREKYLTEEVVAGIRDKTRELPRDILLLYAQIDTHHRGDPPPKETPPFEKMVWHPTRLARMANVVEEAGKFFFDIQVQGYPTPGREVRDICNALYSAKATPFQKWIAFVDRHDGFDALFEGSSDDNWSRIVELLDQPPFQFAGDLFWRVVSLKKSGRPHPFEPRRRAEIDQKSIRQLSPYFKVQDSSMYVAEIATIRSQHGRSGGKPPEYKVNASSDDRDILRVVGTGDLEPRQYTIFNVEFETGNLAFPKARRVRLALSTNPRDGDWPHEGDMSDFAYKREIKVSGADLEAARAGKKVCTIRRGIASVRNDRIDLTDGQSRLRVRITRIDTSKKFGQIGMEEARGEGFESVSELRSDLRKYYRNMDEDHPVTVIWFALEDAPIAPGFSNDLTKA